MVNSGLKILWILSLLILFSCLNRNEKCELFSSEIWKESDLKEREKIAFCLEKQKHILLGKTEPELIILLGKPFDDYIGDERVFTYCLGEASEFKTPYFLTIGFDTLGRVNDFIIQ